MSYGNGVKEIINLFDTLAEADVNYWVSNIEPWNAICDAAIDKLGPHWGIIRLSVLASGIKSLSDRGSWSELGWKPSAGLCMRMRYARLRSGNTAWWQHQIVGNQGSVEKLLICSMMMTWCTPKVLLALRSEITEILLSMTPEYWDAFTGVVGGTLYATDAGGKRISLDYTPTSDQSIKFMVALELRFSLEGVDEVLVTLITDYHGVDPEVAGYLTGKGLRIAHSRPELWGNVLRICRLAYKLGASAAWSDPEEQPPPLSIAQEICQQATLYPQPLVRVAQRIVAAHVGSNASKLGDIADRDRWFAML
nr:hypothetical protein [Methylobacterium sp. L1A1]